MTQNGAILLHRQLRECAELAEPEALALWVHLLLMAAHKPTKVNYRKKVFQLQRGQVLSSLRQLVADTNIKIHPLRRFIELFTKMNMIKMVTATRTSGRIITICKYEDFQTLSTGTVTTTVTRRSQARHNEQEREERILESSLRSDSKKNPSPNGEGVDFSIDPFMAVRVWNQICGDILPKVTKLTAGRRTSLKKRLADDCHGDLQAWKCYCQRIRASDFCCGSNDRAWVATIDFALRPGTFARINEGGFDNRKPTRPRSGGDYHINAARNILQTNEEVDDEPDPFIPGTCDEVPHEAGGPRTHALEIRGGRNNGTSRLC